MTYSTRPFAGNGRESSLRQFVRSIAAELTWRKEIANVRASGLLDSDWYLDRWPDVNDAGMDACTHFCKFGWKEGRSPNPYFDVPFYESQMPASERASLNPLFHYIRKGEKLGLRPGIYFDPAWYRAQYGLSEKQSPLRHYLQHATSGKFSPVPDFDVQFYLENNPDVRNAGTDPFWHYVHNGRHEGRKPMAVRKRTAEGQRTWSDEIRRFTSSGPAFEEFRPLAVGRPRQAKVLAYYLPQYHAIPENDEWWGKGFTEWTNLARGVPRFKDHYQPRIPRDLGFYDLLSSETMRRQIDMARGAGLFGFVFYFYWFNRRRLLEKPLDMFVEDTTFDFPFCLMWTNENWTRRWDGFDDEVLIAQKYDLADEDSLIATFIRYFRDPRYIRVDGRPLLMIYRPGLIPNASHAVERWRRAFRRIGNENPIIIMAQGFGDTDPRQFGLDGAIEFPPHKLMQSAPKINGDLDLFDPEFNGHVYSYDAAIERSLNEVPPPFPLIKTAFPSWDNDARRQGNGMTIHGSTPATYEYWLSELITYAGQHPFMGEKFVCVSAWNEWAEGAYLEPDTHFGAAYLNATARAITAGATTIGTNKIVLIGHDAAPHGAQMNLLQFAKVCRRRFGMDVEVILLDDGPLTGAYNDITSTRICADEPQLSFVFRELYQRGFRYAILNSSASASAARPAHEAGFTTTMLVHEQPMIITAMGLKPVIQRALNFIHYFIFAAEIVRERFLALFPIEHDRTSIHPQGCYADIRISGEARARIRSSLGVASCECVVLGVGYADLRKGFDLFLSCWRRMRTERVRTHFIWLGTLDKTLDIYLRSEIDSAVADGNFHVIPFQPEVSPYYSAADIFFLSSREDPFPTVGIEALQAGVPIVAFEGAGGMSEFIRHNGLGRIVPLADTDAVAAAIAELHLLTNSESGMAFRKHLLSIATNMFAYENYVAVLLRAGLKGYMKISVIVPNYNYARYLERRLSSIFIQTYPIFELIVLDDCSSDGSMQELERIRRVANRDFNIIRNEENAGSVFKQWRKGAALAQGDFIWIAEADDEADPRLLDKLAQAILTNSGVVLAYTDSKAIDANGREIMPSYKPYCNEAVPGALQQDCIVDGREFVRRYIGERNLILNVSSALLHRTTLLAALDGLAPELDTLRLAGDWRVYVEMLANENGKVAYIAEPLNIHRRHETSTTGSLEPDRHVAELRQVQHAVQRLVGPDAGLAAMQTQYLKDVARQLGASPMDNSDDAFAGTTFPLVPRTAIKEQ